MRQKEFEEKGTPCYEGKTIMENKGFEQLQTLSLDPKYTTEKQREFIPCLNAWSRCFGSRIDTTQRLLLSSMRWNQDGIGVTVPQHKGDQGGHRVIERHAHANPYDPLHCPLFWTAVRMLTCPEFRTSQYLFGSDAQQCGDCDVDADSDSDDDNLDSAHGSTRPKGVLTSRLSVEKPKKAVSNEIISTKLAVTSVFNQ